MTLIYWILKYSSYFERFSLSENSEKHVKDSSYLKTVTRRFLAKVNEKGAIRT